LFENFEFSSAAHIFLEADKIESPLKIVVFVGATGNNPPLQNSFLEATVEMAV
jgi:hypothetical protein